MVRRVPFTPEGARFSGVLRSRDREVVHTWHRLPIVAEKNAVAQVPVVLDQPFFGEREGWWFIWRATFGAFWLGVRRASLWLDPVVCVAVVLALRISSDSRWCALVTQKTQQMLPLPAPAGVRLFLCLRQFLGRMFVR